MTVPAGEVVTWVRVEKPTFDLAGVLLSSLTFSAMAALVAFVLGCALGGLLILRSRKAVPERLAPLRLDLTST